MNNDIFVVGSSKSGDLSSVIEFRKKLVEALDDAEMRRDIDEALRDAYFDEFGCEPDKSWYGDWSKLSAAVDAAYSELHSFDHDYPFVL